MHARFIFYATRKEMLNAMKKLFLQEKMLFIFSWCMFSSFIKIGGHAT